MSYPFVLVLGGSGFLGSHLVAKLSQSGRRILVATRRYEHAKHLAVAPGIDDIVVTDIHDDNALNGLMLGMDAVVNLVGILHSTAAPRGARYSDDFAKVHVELPRRIVAACAANHVRRYLHMSALGADMHGPSMYLRSKADGEKAACSNPAVATTVFRPSVVFGEEDRFLNLFATMQKFLPIVPLACADAKFQPIYVQDVAQAFVNALDNDHTIGHTYKLAGPKVYTLRELVMLAGKYSGHQRPVFGLPPLLARIQAWLLEHIPGEPLMSRDNLDSMKTDNVATSVATAVANTIAKDTIASELGIRPVALEAMAPYYLAPDILRSAAAYKH